YRNHGSAHGRVLAGIQVPAAALDRFRTSLQQLGYRHTDQSENLAYKVFLT
ncbi:MAG: threonine ammonia-lyase, biosynthetic, partial [Oscillochloris sp.]|nr:threonine ammonia-lyase, biosynthetic [Oscillochloris sp.]